MRNAAKIFVKSRSSLNARSTPFVGKAATSQSVANKQLKAALVDQMLLSSEKRLARLLLRLVPTEKEIEPDLVDILINQDMIARMVGTTRSRINEFMNKFRKLGHIEYSHDRLKVYSSLNAILTDGDA